MFDRVFDDLRHGARILTKAPGLSAMAALLIALVVGGNATVYSMVNSVVRRPALGVTAADSDAVPQALPGVDPRVALWTRETLSDRLEQQALSARLISTLLAVFAGISLLIAAIGQYATVTFETRRRTRDFGVRIALGASGRQIVASVLRNGAGLTAAGLAGGFLLSAAVATVLRAVLFGIRPTDPMTYLSVFVLLACVSLFACYLPARRASRIDPVQALRQE